VAGAETGEHTGRASVWAGFRELDRLLRGDLTAVSALRSGKIDIAPRRLTVCIVALAILYGLCMGSFAVFRAKGPSALQVIASMIKVPLLFYLTLAVTLPSLYVFNALVGSRLGLGAVIRLLIASLGVMVSVLASLGPIVAFFSVSTTSYPFMVLFNVVVFAVSGGLGLAFLLQTLHRLSIAGSQGPSSPESAAGEPSSADSPGPLDAPGGLVVSRHVKTVFRLWVIVFGLVGAQMGWVLRPFVGNPNLPFTWLRGRESNFFIAVLERIQSLFSS
jgi:hypothetical protein